MKRALVVTHVRHEDLAGLRAPVERAGYGIETVDGPTTRIGAGWRAADLVIVMGGPMGVYEQDAHPWLRDEVDGLAARINSGGPTLGICLGSQLIAAALGAEVFAGPVKEVGFAPVRLLAEADPSPLRHLAEVPLLHWHGDSFTLPPGVERLAETEAYANQAFRRGRNLLAVQFHPEVGDSPGFESWLDGADAYVAEAGTTTETIRRDHRRYGAIAASAGRAMLTEWLDLLQP